MVTAMQMNQIFFLLTLLQRHRLCHPEVSYEILQHHRQCRITVLEPDSLFLLNASKLIFFFPFLGPSQADPGQLHPECGE